MRTTCALVRIGYESPALCTSWASTPKPSARYGESVACRHSLDPSQLIGLCACAQVNQVFADYHEMPLEIFIFARCLRGDIYHSMGDNEKGTELPA